MMRYLRLVIISLLLVGCARIGGHGKVKIVYMFWSNTPEELSITETMVKEFEKANPDIKVKMMNVPPAQYYDKLTTMIAAGTPPDVFYIQPETFAAYYVKGALMDLTPFVEKDKDFKLSNYWPQIIDAFSVGGKLYATPRDVANYVLFYNKDLFDRFGVPYPDETWDWYKFVKMAKKLTRDLDGDGKIDIFGLSSPHLYSLIYQNGGRILNESLTRCTLMEPPAYEAIRFFFDIFFKYHVAPQREETADRPGTELFKAGVVAMDVNGRWWVPPYRNITKFEWDVAPLPKGKKRASVLLGLGHAVSSKTKHPEAAWKLAAFLAEEKAQELTASLGIAVPAYIKIAYSDLFLRPDLPPKNSKVFLDTIKYSIPLPRTPKWREIERIIWENLEEVTSRQSTLADVLPRLCEKVNRVLAEAK